MNTINIAVVPLWLSDVLAKYPQFNKANLASLHDLNASAILSNRDIRLYYEVNKHFHQLTNTLFPELVPITTLPNNVEWYNSQEKQFKESNLKADVERSTVGFYLDDKQCLPFHAVMVNRSFVILFEKRTNSEKSSGEGFESDLRNFLITLGQHISADDCCKLHCFGQFIVHDK